jgi:hypothetical protein
VAWARGATIIPVGRSGGYAGEVYPILPRPACASEANWQTLGDSQATPDQVVHAVHEIVTAYLRQG